MKPRSAIQRQFVELAGQLPPLDEWRLEWAKKLFPAEALYSAACAAGISRKRTGSGY